MAQLETAVPREKEVLETPEKSKVEVQHHEDTSPQDTTPQDSNLVYDVEDEEPEIHMRTYVALASMFALNLVQVFALQGPPAVVSTFDSPPN